MLTKKQTWRKIKNKKIDDEVCFNLFSDCFKPVDSVNSNKDEIFKYGIPKRKIYFKNQVKVRYISPVPEVNDLWWKDEDYNYFKEDFVKDKYNTF